MAGSRARKSERDEKGVRVLVAAAVLPGAESIVRVSSGACEDGEKPSGTNARSSLYRGEDMGVAPSSRISHLCAVRQRRTRGLLPLLPRCRCSGWRQGSHRRRSGREKRGDGKDHLENERGRERGEQEERVPSRLAPQVVRPRLFPFYTGVRACV